MIPDRVLARMVEVIHSEPELSGCMIGLHGDNQSRVIDPGNPANPSYHRVVVIVEEIAVIAPLSIGVIPGPRHATSAPTTAGPPRVQETRSVTTSAAAVTNGSRVQAEFIGAGLSCGLTVVSALGVAGSVAAEVPSGGTSTFLLVMSWTGLVTSGIQCVNGIVRAYETVANPESISLQEWDDNRIYSTAILVVDAVGVLSAVATLPAATRNFLRLLERRGSLVSAEALAGLGREQRVAAVQRALQQTATTPEGRAALEQALRESGLSARQVRQVLNSANASRQAVMMGRYSEEVRQALSTRATNQLAIALRDVLGGAGGIAASATPAQWTGSASGSVNALGSYIVHIAENRTGDASR